MNEALFLNLLSFDNKSTELAKVIESSHAGLSLNSTVHLVDPTSFSQIPGSTFAYWVSEKIRHIFIELPAFENEGRTVKQGLATADDFRFVRLWWEVKPEITTSGTAQTQHEQFRQQTFSGKRWVPFAKGGAYSQYYSDLHLIVNWERDGEEIRNFDRAFIRNESFYFQAGLTWPLRTQRGLSVRIFPTGCIFSHKGPVMFSSSDLLLYFLGVANSIIFQELVALQMAFGSYEIGVIQRTPIPYLSGPDGVKLGKLVLSCVNLKRNIDRANETSHAFHLTTLFHTNGDTLTSRAAVWQSILREIEQQLTECQREINEIAFRLYNIGSEDRLAIAESLVNVKSIIVGEAEMEEEDSIIETSADLVGLVVDLLSYLVGCIYGRWDVRFATGERPMSELIDDPMAPLPVCSPGMLIGDDNLPLNETPLEYPLEINWEGILVDDQDHQYDIIFHMRLVLRMIWHNRAESIEQEICQILEVKELREYFRRPGNSGFWMDHVKRYSKSRRKAPIYWLLQSSKKNYALWLYYQRLDKDTLFKALTKYVEPKIRLEHSRLEQWRAQLVVVGNEGRQVKQLERQLERQESLVTELYEFRDKLRRAADLNLEPDLNDGVVLNIAPLRELVPWGEAKKYWDELLARKYEWSSISKQLRSKGVI